MSTTQTQAHIKWIIRRDMDGVLAIEAGLDSPWLEEEYIRCLRQRNVIGLVAEVDDCVAGVILYELHKDRLHVVRFAVHPRYRRQGVGRQLIQKLRGKLNAQRRSRLTLLVRETDLDTQRFLRAVGAKAKLAHQAFGEWEDGYEFTIRFAEATP